MGGDSLFSSSSVTGGGGSSVRRRDVHCDCGFEASLVTCWKNDNGNYGMRFYGCGRFKEQNKRLCQFFKWYDELEGNPRDKKVIAGLLRKIDDMQKKQDMLGILCIVGWGLFGVVLLLLVILIVKMMKWNV